jgi:hypothetical protein
VSAPVRVGIALPGVTSSVAGALVSTGSTGTGSTGTGSTGTGPTSRAPTRAASTVTQRKIVTEEAPMRGSEPGRTPGHGETR